MQQRSFANRNDVGSADASAYTSRESYEPGDVEVS